MSYAEDLVRRERAKAALRPLILATESAWNDMREMVDYADINPDDGTIYVLLTDGTEVTVSFEPVVA